MPDAAITSVFDEIRTAGGWNFQQVAAWFPAYRGGGKTLNAATIWRWHTRGSKLADGRIVRLEAVRVGSRLITSEAAVRRFAAATSAPAAPQRELATA